jgi:hypothetical protein
MNIYEAEKVVTCSLIKQGAFCRTETVIPGINNIIVTWKSTLWRIVVRIINKDKDLSSCWPTEEEINIFQNKAKANNQTIVIAFVNPSNSIEYRIYEDRRVIRPRCITKVKKANDLIKVYN